MKFTENQKIYMRSFNAGEIGRVVAKRPRRVSEVTVLTTFASFADVRFSNNTSDHLEAILKTRLLLAGDSTSGDRQGTTLLPVLKGLVVYWKCQEPPDN